VKDSVLPYEVPDVRYEKFSFREPKCVSPNMNQEQ